MDAFFASVEQRDNPELRGKPVAVGGGGDRGVVAAASYEARKFGVRSAMPSRTAKRLCPHLIFTRHRFDVYKEVSQQIREIFHEYTDLVEPLSLDEAYLDVTENHKNMPIATEIAEEIRAKILARTNLTASAGISYCKFLAKIASDMNKPNGQFVIKPAAAEAFIEQLPIRKFHGIGKVTAAKMTDLGIHNGKDLKEKTKSFLVQHFGKTGRYYFHIVRGEDNRDVQPHRERKSVGVENTYSENLHEIEDIEFRVNELIDSLLQRLDRNKAKGRTFTLKVKFADFQQVTRSITADFPIVEKAVMQNIAKQLFSSLLPLEKGVRLLGVSISNLQNDEVAEGTQLRLDL
jgi:DNA polymerase-4